MFGDQLEGLVDRNQRPNLVGLIEGDARPLMNICSVSRCACAARDVKAFAAVDGHDLVVAIAYMDWSPELVGLAVTHARPLLNVGASADGASPASNVKAFEAVLSSDLEITHGYDIPELVGLIGPGAR